MRYTVERNFVQVIGYIWYPDNVLCAYEYPLNHDDIEDIGEFTRENVEQWVRTHTGDFRMIVDCAATIGDRWVRWKDEESGYKYSDMMYPA